jgi:hypothetical protein
MYSMIVILGQMVVTMGKPQAVTHNAPERGARDLYGLSREDWVHLTGTFTYGSGETKAELDEIIRQSRQLWAA